MSSDPRLNSGDSGVNRYSHLPHHFPSQDLSATHARRRGTPPGQYNRPAITGPVSLALKTATHATRPASHAAPSPLLLCPPSPASGRWNGSRHALPAAARATPPLPLPREPEPRRGAAAAASGRGWAGLAGLRLLHQPAGRLRLRAAGIVDCLGGWAGRRGTRQLEGAEIGDGRASELAEDFARVIVLRGLTAVDCRFLLR